MYMVRQRTSKHITGQVSCGEYSKMPVILRVIIVGLVAGGISALVAALVLPVLGLSNYALPVVVGLVAGAVGPWATKTV